MFVFRKSDETLAQFAADICALLLLSPPEERESLHYVNGRYYRSKALGMEVIIGDAENYDFMISVNACGVHLDDRGFEDGVADLMARRVALAGYRVARPLSPRTGSPVVWYHRNEQENAPYEQAVLVEERAPDRSAV